MKGVHFHLVKKALAFFIAFLLGFSLVSVYAAEDGQSCIVVIPIEGEITPAMAEFVKDKMELASIEQAEGILIEMDTLGGRVDSAIEMKEAILRSRVPVAVYIKEKAISAGALIAIASKTIIMAPGSAIGDAEPIPLTEKNLAFVRSEFRRTAEYHGRDTRIAEAMVDKSIDLPDLAPSGRLLTMTALEAKEKGYAEAILGDRQEVLQFLGWEGARVIETELDFKMKFAQFLTQSQVASLLLTIGMIALVIEFFTQGFGLAGIVGILCYLLYFGGAFLAGHTEWWSIGLFLIGFGLLVAEMAAPGFGILGIGGIAAMIAGLVFAAPDPLSGLMTVGLAFVLTLVAIPLLYKILGGPKAFQRLVLEESLTADKGYVGVQNYEELLGKIGTVATTLRPSGSVDIDGKRFDVVSEGEYIMPGVRVKVVRVEGSRIIVAKA